MKHKLFFSGQEINLDQTHDAIKMDLQKSIDRFFPTPNEYVVVDNYDEPDTGTLAIHITRMYSQGKGAGLKDFICDQDESLISGLPVEAFQPFDPEKKPVVAPMCRWNDKMIYSPVCVFIDMWKHMNKVMIKEDIKSIDIDVNTGSISIRAVYE